MGRPESRFVAAQDAGADSCDILAALASSSGISLEQRQDAIARALSGGDGWRDALRLLGGAFALDAKPLSERGEGSINQRTSEYIQRPPLKAGGNTND